MGTDREAVAAPARLAVDPGLFALDDPEVEGGGLRLLCSFSPAAERFFWPRVPRCPVTGAAVEEVELEARGRLWSWCEVGTPLPGADLRTDGEHRLCVVDLPEGLRVPGILIGADEVPLGAEVVGIAVDLREDDGSILCGLGFRAAGGA
jgi:uncharacterized protein